MPIYEYRCQRCEKVFEELIIRKSDEAELRCPGCKESKVARVMSRPAATTKANGSAGACGPVG